MSIFAVGEKRQCFFCFHIGKLQMMLSKLRFHIHDNITSFFIAGLIMWGKKSNGFRAIGSLLIGSTGSAACITFWDSAGTRAWAPRHTIMFFLENRRGVWTRPALRLASWEDGHCGDEVLFQSRGTGQPY